MDKLEEQWPRISELACSRDSFDRTTALARAVSAIEQALIAVDIESGKRIGVTHRLKEWASSTKSKRIPSISMLVKAVEFRNQAIHENEPPEAYQTAEAVSILNEAWRCMRKSFVTKKKAIDIGMAILDSGAGTDVFLYGSLARGSKEPKDIDLLVFDNGDLSFLGLSYDKHNSWEMMDDLYKSSENKAALKCGWLDTVYIDGELFGEDDEYTLHFAQRQRDPLFLLNVADNLLRLDTNKGMWNKKFIPQKFVILAGLRKQLERENIVAPQRIQNKYGIETGG
ncbi:MAG: hypothetical protein QG577_2392 [Thermodesulfobacteriota bacterium]|nr:hypothetical protein [Thermodesulfobacteriota bacterium]